MLISRGSNRGFSLFEIALVLLIITVSSIFAINSLQRDQERKEAANVGEHAKTVGNAVNGYIVNNYATLIGAASTPVTLAQLRAQSLLPASFSDTNIQGSTYTILLRRTGASPNWNIEGLVLTTNPIRDGQDLSRTSLAGVALQEIGPDGGMSYDNSTLSGMEGGWSAAQTDYPGITQAAQVGMRVGYGTSQFTQFLRRDGTLAMTGSLNMGGQNIGSAQNITAAGTVTAVTTSTGALNASGVSTLTGAVNTGGAVTMGGHASMNTGEVRLVVTENASCAGYNSGAFAKNATGVLLSCQGGTWKKASGAGGGGSTYKAFIEKYDGQTVNFHVYRYPGAQAFHMMFMQFCGSCGPFGQIHFYGSHYWWGAMPWTYLGSLTPDGYIPAYLAWDPYGYYSNGWSRQAFSANVWWYPSYNIDRHRVNGVMTPYSVTIIYHNDSPASIDCSVSKSVTIHLDLLESGGRDIYGQEASACDASEATD